jgi:hypothetical protein
MRLQLTCLLDMARKRTPCSLIRCFPAPGERYGSRSHEVLDIREPTDAILLTPVLVTQADTLSTLVCKPMNTYVKRFEPLLRVKTQTPMSNRGCWHIGTHLYTGYSIPLYNITIVYITIVYIIYCFGNSQSPKKRENVEQHGV